MSQACIPTNTGMEVDGLSTLSLRLQTLCLYRELLSDPTFCHFATCCQVAQQHRSFDEVASQYSTFCQALYQSEYRGNLTALLWDQVSTADHVFATEASKGNLTTLPIALIDTVKQDLLTIAALATLTSDQFKALLQLQYPEHTAFIGMLPSFVTDQTILPIPLTVEAVSTFYRTHGVGLFSKYRAFYFTEDQTVQPIANPRTVHLDSIKLYALQKKRVVDNTKSFLKGKPANNVLLYGDRGTGKSTLVHAMLSTFADQGLRMIQITKEDILHLHILVDQLRDLSIPIILFIDDLTFLDTDPTFNTLKAVLEGSLQPLPAHVRIYATTNRRHLIKETFSAREGNELHASDTRDESASLADRFGLTLTFMKPTPPEFLQMVEAIVADRGLVVESALLQRAAKAFAVRKASYSGRVATQFVDEVEAKLSLDLPII